MYLLLTIIKTHTLTSSVAVDDDMHFKIVKLERPPIVTK